MEKRACLAFILDDPDPLYPLPACELEFFSWVLRKSAIKREKYELLEQNASALNNKLRVNGEGARNIYLLK